MFEAAGGAARARDDREHGGEHAGPDRGARAPQGSRRRRTRRRRASTANLKKIDKDLAALDKKLGSPGFVDRAPEDVVEEAKAQRATLVEAKARLEAAEARGGAVGLSPLVGAAAACAEHFWTKGRHVSDDFDPWGRNSMAARRVHGGSCAFSAAWALVAGRVCELQRDQQASAPGGDHGLVRLGRG